jgi:hypothetical protein
MSRFKTRFIVEVRKEDLIRLFESLPADAYFVEVNNHRLVVSDDETGISFEIPCKLKFCHSPYSRISINSRLMEKIKHSSCENITIEGTKFGTFIFGDYNVSIEP